MTPAFVGFVIVPLVGGAAEMVSALNGARADRMDLSVTIALGSASQIALFVAPVLVLLSYVVGPMPMDLQFWPAAVAMMFFAVLTAVLLTSGGRSAWFVGVLAVMVYLVFATTLYLLPPTSGMIGPSTRVLDPADRTAEVLFGLIMVLTFTGSLSITEAGRADVHVMLVGALGCNLAWGVIDGVLYLMGAIAEPQPGRERVSRGEKCWEPADAHRAICDAVPPLLASVLSSIDLEQLRQRLAGLPESPVSTASLGHGLARRGLRVSAGLSLHLSSGAPVRPHAGRGAGAARLECCGRDDAVRGRRDLREDREQITVAVGAAMVALGLVLVAMTMALGG